MLTIKYVKYMYSRVVKDVFYAIIKTWSVKNIKSETKKLLKITTIKKTYLNIKIQFSSCMLN